ncbi:MAG: DsbA family protein [Hyphomonadaceae bacterium]
MRKLSIAAGILLILAAAAGLAFQQWRGAGEPAQTVADATPQMSPDEVAKDEMLLAAADQPQISPDDRILGSADAPITIIEYASLTCPHCAAFATQTLPQVKSAYIDQGLARLVYRDFPLDRVALKGSLLARCVPNERYFAMIDVLFHSQGEWARADDPVAALAQIGRTAGLDQATIDKCLNDEAETDKIIAEIQAAQDEFQIDSTPTLIINGVKHPGALSFEQLETIFKDLLPKS